MIVTVTPNPSLDRTLHIAEFRRGAVIRATGAAVLDPSGKGVNVSRALHAVGLPTVAVFPSGGMNGAAVVDLLAAERIGQHAVPVGSDTRSNVSVVEPTGVVTKLNEPGAPLLPADRAALVDAVQKLAVDADWVVLCGSLPPQLQDDFYAELVRRIRLTGARIALDTSGPALRLGAGAHPDLIKPNQHELAEIADRPLRTLGDVCVAARQLHDDGVPAVLASLGAAGAVLVDDSGVAWGTSTVDKVVSAVGAGDALLAGFLAAGGAGAGALTEGLAWGAAACLLPGTSMPQPNDIHREAVRIEKELDRDLVLAED